MRYLGFIVCLLWPCFVWASLPPRVTNYVENAPIITSHESLDKLVKYLVRPYAKDEDKALALLTWIVMYVDYDDYAYRQMDLHNNSKLTGLSEIPEQGDILETRLGVCKDIAKLYTTMLSKADIKSRVISGCIGPKNVNMRQCENPHAWTVVWLNNKWEFVDPTYAMGGQSSALQDVKTKLGYKRQVKKRSRRVADTYKKRDNRRVDMAWFKTDPKVMEQDHQPYEKRWRLFGRDRYNADTMN